MHFFNVCFFAMNKFIFEASQNKGVKNRTLKLMKLETDLRRMILVTQSLNVIFHVVLNPPKYRSPF